MTGMITTMIALDQALLDWLCPVRRRAIKSWAVLYSGRLHYLPRREHCWLAAGSC